ncbi:hypothetical protein BP00DRAFT_17057 [Aspergillus indologenus CBS 114.80]|uniref:Uncharacterized protein n=1 Tax=Aspergillus indologenus CBS 114.80 TaxID=1450541 RepID=A0A2V5HUV4_9EURO|nr:hypothetical protein BP00DRAFT_17057 [Aspergillus indologenus CBS 114.80]
MKWHARTVLRTVRLLLGPRLGLGLRLDLGLRRVDITRLFGSLLVFITSKFLSGHGIGIGNVSFENWYRILSYVDRRTHTHTHTCSYFLRNDGRWVVVHLSCIALTARVGAVEVRSR